MEAQIAATDWTGICSAQTLVFEITSYTFICYWKAPKALSTGWNEEKENVSGGAKEVNFF